MTFYTDCGIKPAKINKPRYINEIITHNDSEYKLIVKDIQESYPESYDLVMLLLDEPEVRVIPGWHIGNKTFGGYRWNDTMHVKAWKFRQGDH